MGLRVAIGGDNVTTMVARTGRSVRKDDYGHVSGPMGDLVQDAGVRSAVAAPITVGGRLWGAITAASVTSERLPTDAESRLSEFAELIATAISNLEARAALAASRSRLAAASDEERRRVVRDLHDGAQQRLVHTVITLERAQEELANGSPGAAPFVADALSHARQATAELRELAQGIMPAILTRGGLRAAIESLSDRAPVPVDIEVPDGRLPTNVEATAYLIVAEALTNVAKHAHAKRASVRAAIDDGLLAVEVRDDGVGGARPDGNGLLGLGDRVAALDGRLAIESPHGGGTSIRAELPVREAADG
jgi:signal transduction histidine kinase